MADTTNVTSTSPPDKVSQVPGNEEDEAPSVPNTQAEWAEVPKPNGVAEPSKHATIDKDTTPNNRGEDIEMGDAVDGGEATGTPTAKTPNASTKKASNGSSKKKSAAVPEHKTKKLNKKASKRMTNLDARPGEYYLARMKDTRPVTTRLPDGSFKKPEYEDGGKRAYERTFPIMFLHTNEFAWMPNTDLTPLDTNTCKDTTEKGKSKPLLAAYEKAAEQHGLDYFKDMLADHQKAVKEDLEAQAERDAKKAHKSKRKSTDVTIEDADDMDVDDEAEGPKPKSKKRKKEFDSDGDEKPASKTPKTGTKLKLSTPKTPAETSSKKKPGKPKISAKKAAKGSDDEPVDTPKVEEKPLTPAEAKRMKEKKVLYFRHKLQRGFISRDDTPKEDEMKLLSDFLAELETYRDLEGSIIKTTKINKVLKAIIKLPSIPLDEEYGFKERSIKLLGKWNEILSNDAATAPPANKEEAKAETVASTTNGNAAESKEKSEKGGSAAPENEAKNEAKTESGTAVEEKKDAEGEVEAAKAPETSEKTSDEPNIESAPTKEYQPPTVEAAS